MQKLLTAVEEELDPELCLSHLGNKHRILSAFLTQAQTVNFKRAEANNLFTDDFQLEPAEKGKGK